MKNHHTEIDIDRTSKHVQFNVSNKAKIVLFEIDILTSGNDYRVASLSKMYQTAWGIIWKHLYGQTDRHKLQKSFAFKSSNQDILQTIIMIEKYQ